MQLFNFIKINETLNLIDALRLALINFRVTVECWHGIILKSGDFQYYTPLVDVYNVVYLTNRVITVHLCTNTIMQSLYLVGMELVGMENGNIEIHSPCLPSPCLLSWIPTRHGSCFSIKTVSMPTVSMPTAYIPSRHGGGRHGDR